MNGDFPARLQDLRLTRFSLDDFDPKDSIEGFAFDQYWNGFDVPLFSYDQAMELVSLWNKIPLGFAKYERESDTFVFSSDTWEEHELFHSVIIEGVRFYSIGGWAWCWTASAAQGQHSVEPAKPRVLNVWVLSIDGPEEPDISLYTSEASARRYLAEIACQGLAEYDGVMIPDDDEEAIDLYFSEYAPRGYRLIDCTLAL